MRLAPLPRITPPTSPARTDRPWTDGRDAARQLASGSIGARMIAAAQDMAAGKLIRTPLKIAGSSRA